MSILSSTALSLPRAARRRPDAAATDLEAESVALTPHLSAAGKPPSVARMSSGSIIAAMPEPSVPFSLLDAARVVARGGTFDAKLEALSAQA
jgi:hypothetical protein